MNMSFEKRNTYCKFIYFVVGLAIVTNYYCCSTGWIRQQILVLILMLDFLSLLLSYNWYYHTLPQAHMDNRVLYWPRGRVWGGSSSLNAMVYIRGHAEDYNRWHREGAEGWDYERCLPYFRKAQCHELGENRYLTVKISEDFFLS